MILDRSFVLIEEKPEYNIFGRAKCYIDTLIEGPVVDFVYKKNDTTWAMSWYDFNAHLARIPNADNIMSKFIVSEFFYEGPNTGRSVEVVFPKIGTIGFLSIKTWREGGYGGLSIVKIQKDWFSRQPGEEKSLHLISIHTKNGTDIAYKTISLFEASQIDKDLIIRRYFSILSDEEKRKVWEGSGYSKRLSISSWNEFKEIYYDVV